RLDEEDPGVVHHDVGGARVDHDAGDCPLDRGGVPDVAPQVGSALRAAVRERARQPHHVSAGPVQGVRDGEPDSPRRARDQRNLPSERRAAPAHSRPRPPCTSRRNSSRVFASSSSAPRSALVTVLEFCFSTPRIIMHRWYASITTPTPRGYNNYMNAYATLSESRSFT